MVSEVSAETWEMFFSNITNGDAMDLSPTDTFIRTPESIVEHGFDYEMHIIQGAQDDGPYDDALDPLYWPAWSRDMAIGTETELSSPLLSGDGPAQEVSSLNIGDQFQGVSNAGGWHHQTHAAQQTARGPVVPRGHHGQRPAHSSSRQQNVQAGVATNQHGAVVGHLPYRTALPHSGLYNGYQNAGAFAMPTLTSVPVMQQQTTTYFTASQTVPVAYQSMNQQLMANPTQNTVPVQWHNPLTAQQPYALPFHPYQPQPFAVGMPESQQVFDHNMQNPVCNHLQHDMQNPVCNHLQHENSFTPQGPAPLIQSVPTPRQPMVASQMSTAPRRESAHTAATHASATPAQQENNAAHSAVGAQRQTTRLAAVRQRHAATDVRPIRPRHGPAMPPNVKTRPNRGGRGGTLDPPVAEHARVMRKKGDCWRCAIYRDKCDDEDVCQRCVRATARGDLFGCHREKLYLLVGWFLPASMTYIHQQDSLSNTLAVEVGTWKRSNRFQINLTIGWGPPLPWTVCEFSPKTPEALYQYQYFQDPSNRQMKRYQKYSPPLIIEKLDSDHQHFADYLDELYTEQHLLDFSEMCYASESAHEDFQEKLLLLLCKLYLAHDDRDHREARSKKQGGIKSLLKRILRMLILTYIMGHTMTIVEDTLPDVMRRMPPAPASCLQQDLPWAQGHKQISPRITNRQLKFYFCLLRENIYKTLLREMQTMLSSSKDKNSTWLPAFCSMLGFAMVLEEVQCNIQIQADAKTNDEGWNAQRAQDEAKRSCENIDKYFELMVTLFQRKYRDTTWVAAGPLANQTPRVTHPAELKFLKELRHLVEERRYHLEQRSKVPLGQETQCFYTSRLVARFLLPFLSLPPG